MATTAANGYELYSYDATGVTRLTDVLPGSGNGVATFLPYNNKIYMSGSSAAGNYQLYTFDPANGTTALAYVLNPAGSSGAVMWKVYQDKLYIKAYTPVTGMELWPTDGTTTTMLPEMNPGSNDGIVSSYYPPIEYNGSLYFMGNNVNTGQEIY